MSSDDKPSMIGPLAGVVVGAVVFIGVNITSGWAIIPTEESVTNKSWGLSEVERPQAAAAAPAAPAGGAYQTVCQACHQAEGQGMPGAFPPLAGSEWATGDPETPIRIVLAGLKGEIEVKGAKFNSMMPPPPGMTDEKIVEAINHVRTSFGNNASKIDIELVKKVKAELNGRTEPFTAAELQAMRGSGAAEQPQEQGGEAEGEEAAQQADASAEGAAETGEAAPAEPAEAAEGAAPAAPAQAPQQAH